MLERSAYIFTDNTDTEQLHAAQEQDQYDDCGIARDIDSQNQLLQNHEQQVQKSCNGGHRPKKCSDPQGPCGITDNAVNGIIEQLPKTPLGGTGSAFAGDIGDIASAVSNPSENALGKTVILSQGDDAFSYATSEGAKVAGVRF